MVNKRYLNTTIMIVGSNQRSLIVQPPTALFEALANFFFNVSVYSQKIVHYNNW